MPDPSRFSSFWKQIATSSAPWVIRGQSQATCSDVLLQAWNLGARETIRPGDDRALLCPGGPPTLLSLLAIWLHQGVAVLLNPRLPESQRRALLQSLAGPSGASIPEFSQAAKLENAPQQQPLVPPEAWPELEAGRPAAVVFTSGSSGTPKAALLSLDNFLWNALGANERMPLEPSDGWLLSLPLFHVGGLSVLFRTLLAGARVVLPEAADPGEALQDPAVTHVSLVPTQLHRLLESEAHVARLRTLKLILIGGAGVAPSLLRRCGELELPVQASYGCTEMASQVATGPLEEESGVWRVRAQVLPYRALQVDGTGEIRVRGPSRFLGYRESGGLRQPFDPGGWFATRDLGRLEGERLEVLGRKDSMFISGGENLHPEAIEKALLEWPGALQTVVVSVKDDEYGARPVAFLEARGTWQEHQVQAFLQERLSGLQTPDLVLPWPEVPAGIKPPRTALAAQAQPVFDQWVRWRPFRNWMRLDPPGWRAILRWGERQVFEVWRHLPEQLPARIHVLADSRKEVIEWLFHPENRILQVPASESWPEWESVSEPLHRTIREGLEVVRLLEADPRPDELLAWETRSASPLESTVVQAPQLSLCRGSFSVTPQELEGHAAALALAPEVAPPKGVPEAVLQWGLALSEFSRCYRIRCLYRFSEGPPTFLGWKVQALREADNTLREQPFHDLSEVEEFRISEILLQQNLCQLSELKSANIPDRERARREDLQQRWLEQKASFIKDSGLTTGANLV